MGKGRLEAFTDGVMAIIITIMVLEIKVPSGTDLVAFSSSLPILFTYALSFLNVGKRPPSEATAATSRNVLSHPRTLVRSGLAGDTYQV